MLVSVPTGSQPVAWNANASSPVTFADFSPEKTVRPQTVSRDHVQGSPLCTISGLIIRRPLQGHYVPLLALRRRGVGAVHNNGFCFSYFLLFHPGCCLPTQTRQDGTGASWNPRNAPTAARRQDSGGGEGGTKKVTRASLGNILPNGSEEVNWLRGMLTFVCAVEWLVRYGFLRAQADRGSSGWLFYLNLSGGHGKGRYWRHYGRGERVVCYLLISCLFFRADFPKLVASGLATSRMFLLFSNPRSRGAVPALRFSITLLTLFLVLRVC